MEKKFFQTSIKDSLFTGLIALALFGPIVGLRTVAKNEVLEVHPKWFIVLIIVIVCAVGRFLTNLYVYNRDQKTGIQSSIGKSISNFFGKFAEGSPNAKFLTKPFLLLKT